MTSVPAGSPLCSAVRRTCSAVTNARAPLASLLSSDEVPCCSATTYPQSPSDTLVPGPAPTPWPSTAGPLTDEPSASAADERPFADARAFATTLPTVTSPLKSESEETSADALEVADVPGVANAPEVTEPARTTEPSAGYAKLPPTPTASGGAETDAADPPPWPGTATWIANARADGAAAVCHWEAPAAPTMKASEAAPRAKPVSRTTPGLCGMVPTPG